MAAVADFIDSVRFQIPDANADFVTDAKLLLWINQACEYIGNHAPIIQDWYAVPTVSGKALYTLPQYITSVEECWYDLYTMARAAELDGMFRFKITSRAWWFSPHTIGANPVLHVSLFPERSGSMGVLQTTMTASSRSVRTTSSLAGLMPYGFVRATSSGVQELLHYSSQSTGLVKLGANQGSHSWHVAAFNPSDLAFTPYFLLSTSQDWIVAKVDLTAITGFTNDRKEITLGETKAGTGSSFTFNYTLPNDVGNAVVMVHIFQASGAVPTVSSITIDGTVMSTFGTGTTLNRRRLEGKQLASTSITGKPGTKSVVVTLSAAATEVYITTLFQRGAQAVGTVTVTTGTTAKILSTGTVVENGLVFAMVGNTNAVGVASTEPDPGANERVVSNVLRGQGGTIAAAHTANDVVEECNLVMKVFRLPRQITAVTDDMELPRPLWPLVELWIMAKIRESEQDHVTARQDREEFYAVVKELASKAALKGYRQGRSIRTDAPSPEVYFDRVIVP